MGAFDEELVESEMLTRLKEERRSRERGNPILLVRLRRRNGIPACAGMTGKLKLTYI
jgi:hypothetical protein